MANYNVGNIEIGFISSAKGFSQSIDKIIENLKKFSVINKELQNVFFRINQLANGFKRIERTNFNVVEQNLRKVADNAKKLSSSLEGVQLNENAQNAIGALNKVANAFRKFEKLADVNMEELKQKFQELSVAIDPLLIKLKESEASLVSFSNILNKLKARTITTAQKEVSKLDKQAKRTTKTLNKMFDIGRIYFLFNYTKRLTSGLANIAMSAINFTETLNKYQVSFGDLYEENLRFVNSLTYAFNFSTESIMNYQSTFKNMLSALGSLSNETSAELSQTLTRMAIDYASLFNVEVDRAMSQFQSVLSGQINEKKSSLAY